MSITVKEAIAEATAQKKEKITFEKFGEALGVSKQYISQIRNKELSAEQITKKLQKWGIITPPPPPQGGMGLCI